MVTTGGTGGAGAGGSAPTLESLFVTSRHRTPVAGIHVVVHDATGTAIDEVTTAADGFADFDVPEGGLFTAVWVANDDAPTEISPWVYRRAVTYHEVEQGAAYEFQIDTRDPEAAMPSPMRFTFNFSTLPPGATYIATYPGCGVFWDDPWANFNGVVEVQHVGCPGLDEVQLVLAAKATTGDQPFGFYILPPTTFDPGAEVAIDLSAANFFPPGSSTVDYDLGPYSYAGFATTVFLPNGERVFGGASGVDSDADPLMGSLLALHPSGVELFFEASTNLPLPGTGLRPRTELAWRGTPPQEPLISVIPDVAYPSDTQASFTPDPARPSFTCTLPAAPQADALWMSLRYYTTGIATHQWDHFAPVSAVSPAGLLSLQTPALPPSLAEVAPAATSMLNDIRCAARVRTGSTGSTDIGRPVGPDEFWRSQMLGRDLN